MGKKKRGNIMGSKPAVDPMSELSGSQMTVISDNEIRWDNRTIKHSWDQVFAVTIGVMLSVFWFPYHTILVTGISLVLIIIVPILTKYFEHRGLKKQNWYELPEPDLSFDVRKKSILSKGVSGEQHIIALAMKKAKPNLQGDLGKLLRGLDTSHGFLMVADLFPEKPKNVVRDGVVTDLLERYLDNSSSSQRNSYFDSRGGLWRSQLYFLGHSSTMAEVRMVESQVKGSIPDRGLKRIKMKELSRRLKEWDLCSGQPTFYATGSELTEWLVQLPSELGPEVGSNVPGEFIAPIRSRSDDYNMGTVVNPETLRLGPSVGLMHDDLEQGLLICGGDWKDRDYVISVLIDQLLQNDKRVLFITVNENGLRLKGLSSEGIGMTLGKDLILNPVDSEGISRPRYVSELLLLLETLAGTNLSSAADFEIALSRVVSLGSGTLADVVIDPEHDAIQDGSTAVAPVRIPQSSQQALSAIKRLHQGSGARAFYGTQTAPLTRLAQQKLAVVSLTIGAMDLDMFALDLMCLKLTGLEPDPNLIVIIDTPENLSTDKSVFRYSKRGILSEQITRSLLRRGPLVLSVNNPSSLVWDTSDSLGSCIALRMRESSDIAHVSDLLSLNVVGGGIHSKARQSSRESSFLRMMERGYALLSHEQAKSCMPFKIGPLPEMREPSHGETILTSVTSVTPHLPGSPKTLIDTVGGKDSDSTRDVLKLLQRYEPLTEEAVRRFLAASGGPDVDVEAILARLENSSMILRGHEQHAGISYKNYRITMKGSMALRQSEEVGLEG
ncbi:MAG: hypothetical protein ACW99G_00995 [Candidatus Thorarchaeota archaeon]|jgi:hypothetical protein